MNKFLSLLILCLFISTAAMADSPVVNFLINNNNKDKEAAPAPVEQDKTLSLSPAARQILKQHEDMLSAVPQKTKDEIKSYEIQQKALYDKLSPEAKAVLAKRLEDIKSMSPAIKSELQSYYQSNKDSKD